VQSEIAQAEAELHEKRKKQERILRVYRKPVVVTA
jgi:preprotein translocase subunit Sss1